MKIDGIFSVMFGFKNVIRTKIVVQLKQETKVHSMELSKKFLCQFFFSMFIICEYPVQ